MSSVFQKKKKFLLRKGGEGRNLYRLLKFNVNSIFNLLKDFECSQKY